MNPNSETYPSTLPQQPVPYEAGPRYGQPGHYGAPAPRGPIDTRPPSMWARVPIAFWVALGIGAVAFVVRISYQETLQTSAGYSCNYNDFAGYGAAVALVVLAIAGWQSRAGRRTVDRLPVPLMAAVTILILALAFVHALRGSGTIMSPCDAGPGL